MARLKKIVRRATRGLTKIGQIALPLVFPAIGMGGLPPFVGIMEEGEPTEGEEGPPFPPEEEPEVEEEGF